MTDIDPPDYACALEEVHDLRRHIRALYDERDISVAAHRRLGNAYKDCETERLFWRSCAERALRLWERGQDDLEDAKRLAGRAARLAKSYIEIVSDLDDPAEVEDDREQCDIWLEQLEDADAPDLR